MNDECYVYIALPGETDFVTAGRFLLTADRHGIPTGRIARRRIASNLVAAATGRPGAISTHVFQRVDLQFGRSPS